MKTENARPIEKIVVTTELPAEQLADQAQQLSVAFPRPSQSLRAFLELAQMVSHVESNVAELRVVGLDAKRVAGRLSINLDATFADKMAAHENLLQSPLAELALSIRARKAILCALIREDREFCVGSVTELTPASLLARKGTWRVVVTEIQTKLAEYGLKLRE